jgi:hypothetical protein
VVGAGTRACVGRTDGWTSTDGRYPDPHGAHAPVVLSSWVEIVSKSNRWDCDTCGHKVKRKFGYCNKCQPELKCLDVDAQCRIQTKYKFSSVPCPARQQVEATWAQYQAEKGMGYGRA